MTSPQDPRPVFLLTDFGTRDPYVGLMKSSVIRESPRSNIVDLTHEVDPQDEDQAAFLLEYCLPDLPDGAVVAVVVDPGVGTDRAILAIEVPRSIQVVVPDTGIAGGLQWERAYRVENESLAHSPVSSTFHGRDWFAPVAGFLSAGGDLEEVGPVHDEKPEGSRIPDPEPVNGGLLGRVVHLDRFGNLVTNLKREDVRELAGEPIFRIGQHEIDGMVETYGDATEPAALIGSFDRVELVVPGGSAHRLLGAGKGATVRVTPKENR